MLKNMLATNSAFLTLMPIDSKSSLLVIGSTTASISSWICLSNPPISTFKGGKEKKEKEKGRNDQFYRMIF
jgi:hypothetical protein